MPCTATRCAAGTLSTRRLEPPISPKFQPMPSSHNEGNSNSSTSPDRADIVVAATSSTAPTPMAVIRPRRSLKRPTSGLKAYMPAMCSDTTYWLSILVSVQLEVDRRHRHDRDHGHLRDDHRHHGEAGAGMSADDLDRRARVRAVGAPVAGRRTPPAATSGSGRSRIAVFVAAATKNTAPNSQGPL